VNATKDYRQTVYLDVIMASVSIIVHIVCLRMDV